MDLTLIRSFISVADLGGIGDAAIAQGLSPTALGRRVRLLEEEFGAQLVERSGRGVALTEVGRMVAREGRRLTQRFDALKEDVARHMRLETGVVRVGGGATAVSYLLPRWIAGFRSQNPGVRFEVREAGSRDVEQGVLSEDIELGVVTLPVQSEELVVRPLLTDRIVLVAAKDHPLAKKRRLSARSLEGQSLVGFEAGTKIRQLIDVALREACVTMNVVAELRSIAAILRMMETTGSLAFVSAMGTEGARVVPVSGLKVERQLALISKRGRPLSPAAASFAETLGKPLGDFA
jgi:DNA-binding transcriptional LysR family regulator